MRRAVVIATLFLAVPVFAATRARYLMGTICEVTVPDGATAVGEIAAAFDEAKRIESMLSTWRDDSELSRVNHGATASPELRALLDEVDRWSRETGGAFNPRIRPLIDLWRTRDEGALPSPEAIRAALATPNPGIEEGGFGKGYAIDRMLDVLRARGAASATINFGGQIGAFGPAQTVGIADPRHRGRAVREVVIENASLSTSSGSEKTFIVNGHTFTHIFDPRTGEALPPRGSVSVIHPSALVADILSTALYVMGPEAGRAWARQHGIQAIFIEE
jgi:thiamine biosynthesis lipoprotein